MNTKFRRELRQSLVENFTLEELRILCFDLNVHWDEVRGETLSSKIQALIIHLENREQLSELLTLLREERPHTSWPTLPPTPAAEAKALFAEPGQETTLQAYLKEMRTLLLEHNLKQSELEDDVRKIATTLTFTTLENVNGQQKGAVLKFLYEMGLVTPLKPEQPIWETPVDLKSKFYKPIIFLFGANLSEAQLPGANLKSINLAGANLQNANLRAANLFRAELMSTILSGANLSDADLRQKDLLHSHLLFGSEKKGSSHLYLARLDGANLKDAKVDLSDLAKAATLANAILPDGRRYPDTTSMAHLPVE